VIARFELAKIAALEYFRNFWWFALVIPLFGVIAIVFGAGQLKIIGIMAVCWPLTIPGRSLLATGKSARLFTSGCIVWSDGENLYFEGDDGKGVRMKPENFRKRIESNQYDILSTRRFGIAPVPINAWPDGTRERFLALLDHWQAERLT
jgi:hypothetical protein